MGPASSGRLVLRPGALADLEALLDLETRAFAGDRLSRRSLRRLLGRPSAHLIVAESEGRLVGYALVLFRHGSSMARLYSIARDGTTAPRGTGRALLVAAERAAAARGASGLHLEVRPDNANALHLYESSGYRMTGRRARYYEDGADALRMAKTLGKEDACPAG